MAWELSVIRSEGGLLRLRLSGAVDSNATGALNAALAEHARRADCRRLLLDARPLGETPDLAEVFETITRRPLFRRATKLAIVREGEAPAVRGGLPRESEVRSFASAERAERWLAEARVEPAE
ncbi:MAG TPA: hypothetical protein VFL14_10705 [Xanthomonadales bacterium]|nr:hypothetical protein [Xanthomonadales bacterium]